ncbi:MAG: CDP-alcohol phosphatidyltransferase family protein [Gemmatimonadales bacterium]
MSTENSAEQSKREMTFLLAEPERRLLRWVAARLPRRIRPNHLTGIGVAGAVGTGVAYALTTLDPRWLWAASAMLLVNWFGDSLDGTLARVRKIERPKYGYYIDHVVDAFSTVVVGIGIGLSPYVQLEVALLLVVLYLAMSINVYLESAVFGVFKIAYGIVGPTEMRILLVLANTGLVAGATLWGVLNGAVSLVANWVVGIVTVGMLVVLAVRFGKNLHKLARMEPQRRRPAMRFHSPPA